MKKSLALISLIVFSCTALAEVPKLKSKDEYKSDSQQICAKNWTKRGEQIGRAHV